MLVALFLPWYSTDGTTWNAWEAMAVDDVILAVAAAIAVVAAIVVGFPRLGSLSVAITSLAILPAVIGLVVTIYRLISPAPSVDVSLEYGAWLGLLATAAIAVGAWSGAKDEGPARRSRDAESRAAGEALTRAELLKLPNGTDGNAEPAGG